MKGGRHLRYPDHTPMTNLLLSMLDKTGVDLERLGDSTGRWRICRFDAASSMLSGSWRHVRVRSFDAA